MRYGIVGGGVDTPAPGRFVANMFQVYPYDRGQNYSIELAGRLVRHFAAVPRTVPDSTIGAVPARTVRS